MLAAVLTTAWISCQAGSTAEIETREPSGGTGAALSPYGQDVDNICHSEERSGALERPLGERLLVVAGWLGDNIKTHEGRSFLAQVAQASAAGKVALLDREALAVGLPGCPLARTWAASEANNN